MATVAQLRTNIQNTRNAIAFRTERLEEQQEALNVTRAELRMYKARLRNYATQLKWELSKQP